MKTETIAVETLMRLRELGLHQPESQKGEGMYVFCPGTSGEIGISHGVYHPSLNELLDFVSKQKGAKVTFEKEEVDDKNLYAVKIKGGEKLFTPKHCLSDSWESALAFAIVSLFA